jgi:hypothetical protein
MIVQERRYSSGLLTLIASVNNHYMILEKTIGGIHMVLALSGIPKVMASQDSTTECHYFSFTIQKVVRYRVA